ncbi:Pentatricopeptide repeat, partial [Dillenia turbinata]
GPNEFTLVGALNACSLCGNISQAYGIFGYIVRLGFENNVFLVNAFLTALIWHYELVEAVDVFEKCSCKDIVSWNAIIAGYLQFSYAEVPRFWVRLVGAGVKPDNFTFANVLTLAALSDPEFGLQVHAQLVKYGHGVEICVGNSLVDMYLKNQKLVDGFKAFNEMTSKEEGEKVHALKIKLGSDMDLCVDNALIDIQGGFVNEGRKYFSSITKDDGISPGDDHTTYAWLIFLAEQDKSKKLKS